MTVKEVMELLAKVPPDATVRIANDSHAMVTKVEIGECYGCQRPEVTIR